MKGLVAYSLSKRYTADTADSLGSLKGAPAEVVDVQYGEETTDITLQWEGTSGQIQQLLVEIPNGEKGDPGDPGATGRGISKCKVNSEEHLIITYDDGTTEDAGKITVSGGGGGALEDDLTTSVTVGGIPSGTEYEEGTELETILRDMLNPTAYPTLTNPSASLTATGAKLLETGATLNTTFTLTLNRGSINPQYTAESPYRSGAATSYTFDGETKDTNTFARTITSAKTSYQGSIAYAAGCQPKDSTGNDYNSPLPAGSVTSGKVTYEFVDALYSNQSNITIVAKEPLVSKSAKTKRFDFVAQTVANPEQFHVPSSWNITAIEVLNTMSGQWESCASEFDISDITHEDAAGNSVAYKKYLDNRGYNAGARSVRIKWS